MTARSLHDTAPAGVAWMFAIAAFCMPLKMAFVTTAFTLLAFTGAWFYLARKPLPLRGNARLVALFSLGLFGWAAIRYFGSSANASDAFDSFHKLHEFLVLPVLAAIPLAAWQRERAIKAFVAGNLVAAGISYGKFLGLLPIVLPPPLMYAPPQGPINGGWMMALAAFFCVMLARREPAKRAGAYAAAAIVLVSVLVFLIAGRTAYLSLLVLAALAMAWLPRRRALGVVLVIGIAFMVGWEMSPTLRDRVTETFQPTTVAGPTNSTSIRRELYRVSWLTIREAPLLGHGLGSVRAVYAAKFDQLDSPVEPVANPHSEYLYIWIELGVVGLALFIGLMIAAWRHARELDETSRWVAQGLVLSMAVACLFNSFFHDASPGRAFVLLLAVAMVSRPAGVPAPSAGPPAPAEADP